MPTLSCSMQMNICTKLCFFIAFFLQFHEETHAQTFIKEGVWRLREPIFARLYNSAFSMESERETFIWFKNGYVIYEHKIFQPQLHNKGEIILHNCWITSGYTFFEIATRKAQGYLSFSDTAKPIVTYNIPDTLGENDFVFATKNSKASIDTHCFVSDTSLRDGIYKIEKCIYDKDGFFFEQINLFSVKGFIPEGLKRSGGNAMVRKQTYIRNDKTDKEAMLAFEQKLEVPFLKEFEKRVFFKWQENISQSENLTDYFIAKPMIEGNLKNFEIFSDSVRDALRSIK